MNTVLARWNALPPKEAAEEILTCCRSKAWADKMAAHRPIINATALLDACDLACKSLTESDWFEAFRSHPRIGETSADPSASPRSAAWSREEQRTVESENENIKMAIAEGNRAYEQRFHRIFIICATGESALEILENLKRRLQNDDTNELYEAAEQQRQIAHLRLKKWLAA